MAGFGVSAHIRRVLALFGLMLVAGCAQNAGIDKEAIFAPGIDPTAEAADGITVGHRLISAGEHELALRAFSRAALERGETDAEVLLGLGTANLGLGRLGQAEDMLRLAVEKEGDWPELYNNLGVVLMEQGRDAEAAGIFRKAYALDNGNTDEIRDNLRLALSKPENSVTTEENNNDYKLIQRGSGNYVIRQAL